MAEQLCSKCGHSFDVHVDPHPDAEEGVCFDCSMASEVEEYFFGGTDTQWLRHATDEEIRLYEL